MSTYRGKMENGKIVFIGLVPPIEEGTAVDVVVPATSRSAPTGPHAANDPLRRIGEYAVDTGIIDGSDEHDHYIYGGPKRGPRTNNQ